MELTEFEDGHLPCHSRTKWNGQCWQCYWRQSDCGTFMSAETNTYSLPAEGGQQVYQ